MLRIMPSSKPGERQKRSRYFQWTGLCTRQLHHSPSGLWVSSFGPCRLTLWCGWQDADFISIYQALQLCNESPHSHPWAQQCNQAIKTRYHLLDLVGSCSHINDYAPNNSNAQLPSACFCLAPVFSLWSSLWFCCMELIQQHLKQPAICNFICF